MLYTQFACVSLAIWVSIYSSLVLAKPIVVEKRGKYTVYRRGDEANTNVTNSDYNDIYERIAQNMPRQEGGGIPRKFLEKEKCGNLKDPKSKGSKILAAWEEAKQLARAQTTARFDYDFDKVHKQWLGKDGNGWGWVYDYKTLIANNFKNLAKLFSSDAFQKHEFIYWYCTDYSGDCATNQLMVAYSWSSVYFFWRNHYTVFCPRWEVTETLADDIRWASDDPHKPRIMENFESNRGVIMLHETYHYPVVTNPRTGDYAYRAKASWDLAKNDGTWYAFANADSYALDAVAIYVQQHFKTDEPPIPREIYAGTEAAGDVDLASVTQEKEPVMGKVLPGRPAGWSGAQVPNLNPHPEFWTEVVDEGVTPLSTDLDLEKLVFGDEPHDDPSTMQDPDAPGLPYPTRPPESQPTSIKTDVGDLRCESNGVKFPQKPVEDFIHNLCNSKKLYDRVIVPPISVGTGSMKDGRSKTLGVTASYDLPDSSDKIYLGVMFGNGNTGCHGYSQFGLGNDDAESLDHCKARLHTALNGCQTGSLEKQGGRVEDVCIDYVVTARHESDPDPFDEAEWWKDKGDFKCEETDPATEDSCTCWFEGYKRTTNTFKKDADGKCDKVNRADLTGN